jgi:2-iminobutanoate/2-iminopropanoate deaminase
MSAEPAEKKAKMTDRVVVHSDNAPAAIGPYSQAIKANGMIYVSGCLGMDPTTKKIVEGGVPTETRRVLENMKAVLEAAGSSMSKVVKTTILLQDIASFGEVNAIYGEYFPSEPPARATYAVAALPLGGLVEIECIALA